MKIYVVLTESSYVWSINSTLEKAVEICKKDFPPNSREVVIVETSLDDYVDFDYYDSINTFKNVWNGNGKMILYRG